MQLASTKLHNFGTRGTSFPTHLIYQPVLTQFYLLHSCAGPIPKELGALGRLEKLWLNDNNLTGGRIEEELNNSCPRNMNPADVVGVHKSLQHEVHSEICTMSHQIVDSRRARAPPVLRAFPAPEGWRTAIQIKRDIYIYPQRASYMGLAAKSAVEQSSNHKLTHRSAGCRKGRASSVLKGAQAPMGWGLQADGRNGVAQRVKRKKKTF